MHPDVVARVMHELGWIECNRLQMFSKVEQNHKTT